MRIGMNFKSLFFDRPKVTSAVDKTTRRVLSRFGAFVRRGAKSSIRKRKSVSAPGSPPSSHTGLLKRLIFFVFDPRRRSVVIGPVGFRKSEAPELLEYGGSTTVERRGKREQANYRARPFMGPAFDQEQPKLPQMWRDAIRR
ncbi:MAG: hypothetical protein ACIAXF_06200 [Phycisphaerales bacterium JB063]